MRTKDLDSRRKVTPDELLALIGTSPADNLQGLSTSVSWKSNGRASWSETCLIIRGYWTRSERKFLFSAPGLSPAPGRAA